MSERNKSTIRRIREEAVGRSGSDLDLLDGLYASDYRYHGGAAFGELSGADAFRQLLEGMATVLDGYRERVVDQVAEGDRVATRLAGHGRAVGDLLGVPGQGREIEVSAISLAVFDSNGKLLEEWVEADTYGILKQLGAV